MNTAIWQARFGRSGFAAGSDFAGSDFAASVFGASLGSDFAASALSAGFSSVVALGACAASEGLASVFALSAGLAASSVFAVASGCFAGSEASADLTSALAGAASSRTGALPVVTSDITVWPTEERSSSMPSALAVLVSTGFASVTLAWGAPLSALSPTGVVGSRFAAGCGGTRNEASIGWAKLCGVISPGVTSTRAPILVQFHIFTANAIGMRMQPCEAG